MNIKNFFNNPLYNFISFFSLIFTIASLFLNQYWYKKDNGWNKVPKYVRTSIAKNDRIYFAKIVKDTNYYKKFDKYKKNFQIGIILNEGISSQDKNDILLTLHVLNSKEIKFMIYLTELIKIEHLNDLIQSNQKGIINLDQEKIMIKHISEMKEVALEIWSKKDLKPFEINNLINEGIIIAPDETYFNYLSIGADIINNYNSDKFEYKIVKNAFDKFIKPPMNVLVNFGSENFRSFWRFHIKKKWKTIILSKEHWENSSKSNIRNNQPNTN